MEGPRSLRITRDGRGPAEAAVVLEDELGRAVAGEVDEGRRLVVDGGRDEVTLPRSVALRRIRERLRYQNASFPGNPTTSRSGQPSPSRSRGQAKKLSEYPCGSKATGG